MRSESPPIPVPRLDKKRLTVLFFTCFFDVVGFTIIIPLLPFMVSYYLTEASMPQWLASLLQPFLDLQSLQAAPPIQTILVIGGSFAFLFAICQFLSSPIWGKLSDHFGRSRILFWTILGTCLGHTLWLFSGSIILLLISRITAGLMAGNISVATAAIADITHEENRAVGMTAIGTAYGLGFIAGPIIGGATSAFNPLLNQPSLADYGINPFSICALAAVILSLLNLFCFFLFFRETLPVEKRDPDLKISFKLLTKSLQSISIPTVDKLSWINFLFFFTFIGIEFNLSFLAFERYGFSKQESALIYLLLGLSQTLAQWTVLKPMTEKWGESKVSIIGFVTSLLGALTVALVHTPLALYLGATIMSGGAGLVFPSLTSLVSKHSPANQQGAMLGAFRSKGSIGHALGPLSMSGLFWLFGGTFSFCAMSLGFLGTIHLVSRIKTE